MVRYYLKDKYSQEPICLEALEISIADCDIEYLNLYFNTKIELINALQDMVDKLSKGV